MSALLFQALLTGLAVAVPVGPMGLLCIQLTATRGRAQGLALGAGIATSDFLYAGLAALGLAGVSTFVADHGAVIRIAGALVLVVLGLWMALHPPAASARAASTGAHRTYAAGVLLTLANPPTIASFAGIAAALGAFASVAHALLFAAGVGAGSLLWWVLLTGIVKRAAGWLRPAVLRRLNFVAGLALAALGAWSLART